MVLRLRPRRADLRPRLADERRGMGARAARRGVSIGQGDGGGGCPMTQPPTRWVISASGSEGAGIRCRLGRARSQALEGRLRPKAALVFHKGSFARGRIADARDARSSSKALAPGVRALTPSRGRHVD
jgi:hypothetical protein